MSKENKNNNSKEMRQSAYFLIALGSIGVILLVLELLNVTSILPSGMKTVLILVTIGILCAVFIITGIMSISSSKRMKNKEDEYDKMYSEVTDWFLDGVTPEKLDSLIPNDTDRSEEEMFFVRTAIIQHIIKQQFKITDNEFLQNISEDLYNKIYEND